MRALREVLELPRRRQAEALRELRARVTVPADEAWNTRFGPESLYEAWSRATVMRSLYAHNRRALREVVARDGFRIVEVGGGNGRLWEGLLHEGSRGELVVVDPVPEVHAQVAAVIPTGVRLVARAARVEEVDLPEADAAVASLVLHHVAGADADERARHGLSGPGKREVLERLGASVAAPGGFVLVNEADVYCDLGLAPGDEVLRDRLIDSYVRRCALSLLDDWSAAPAEERARLEALIWRWCVDQVGMADAPREARDVYELDVPRWLDLFEASGLSVHERTFTDVYGLFVGYRLSPDGRRAEVVR